MVEWSVFRNRKLEIRIKNLVLVRNTTENDLQMLDLIYSSNYRIIYQLKLEKA